jgi:copper chaperone CopZ
METQEILVENIKCGGCMTSIKSAIMKFTGVKSVEINLDEEKITVVGKGVKKEAIIKKLTSLGYPEKGQNTIFNQAKSYVSCAVGKMS